MPRHILLNPAHGPSCRPQGRKDLIIVQLTMRKRSTNHWSVLSFSANENVQVTKFLLTTARRRGEKRTLRRFSRRARSSCFQREGGNQCPNWNKRGGGYGKWDLVTAIEGGGARERSMEQLKREAVSASIPSSSLSIDTSLPLPQLKPRIIELCRDLFEKWSDLDNSCFSIETVSGGITNLLLKVSVKEDSGIDVHLTVRLYGPNTDLVIDRKRELQAIPYLSAAGFGAKLLGVFGNGTVQSFIDARTLSPSDMSRPEIAAEIAKELRKFHQVEVPGSKEPQLWKDISRFLEKAAVLNFDDKEKQAKYGIISFKEVQEEINALKDLADRLNTPVVFSHNDLLSGNLMRNDAEERLYFIDFEYGSYSYRGYDIANHFNEYAGFDCDYSLYPNKASQYHFFRNYLQANKSQEVTDKELETLYIETNTFMLASHIYWALWALIQAKASPIDFDYLSYFFLRYSEFKKQKETCFSLAQNQISTHTG